MNDSDLYLRNIADLHRVTRLQLRGALSDLDSDALNWAPAPDTSSIGTLVTHMLGAEAEMLRNILQIETERNRASEFESRAHEPEALLQLLDQADADWEELGARLGESELQGLTRRPGKPTPETGLFWLVRNYGHLREHLAQIQLTRQMYMLKKVSGA